MGWAPIVVVVVMVWFSIAFTVSAIRTGLGSSGRVWVFQDRIDVVKGAADCLWMLVLTRAIGPWEVIPPAVWGLGLGLAVLGLLVGIRGWSGLPVRKPDSRPVGRWLSGAADVALAAVLVALVT
jgi:hypothetical protein